MNQFIKILIVSTSVLVISCSKDKDLILPDTRLPLPAALENNTVQNIPDGIPNRPGGSYAGSDANPGIIESKIIIEKEGIIADVNKVNIEIDVSHPHCGDIVVELISPNGESCGLIKRIGSTTDNSAGSLSDFIGGNKLVFNASNSIPIQAGTNIAAGNYAPTSGASTFPINIPMSSLNTFLISKNIKGIWKIKVYDYGYGDTGSLNSWKLTFEVGALQ